MRVTSFLLGTACGLMGIFGFHTGDLGTAGIGTAGYFAALLLAAIKFD